MTPDLEESLRRFVASRNVDKTHDVDHVTRVWRSCERIVDADALSVDRDVLMAAAYLHDLVVHPKNSAEQRNSSAESADTAEEFLASISFPAEKLAGVRHAIIAHSFSANVKPETTEAEVLQDADRIEALGAIGIARTFYSGFSVGSRLLHPDDPLSHRRMPAQGSFVLDHFGVKALGLVRRMHTPTGRRIAAQRLRFLKSFIVQLLEEAGHSGVLDKDGELRFGPAALGSVADANG